MLVPYLTWLPCHGFLIENFSIIQVSTTIKSSNYYDGPILEWVITLDSATAMTTSWEVQWGTLTPDHWRVQNKGSKKINNMYVQMLFFT